MSETSQSYVLLTAAYNEEVFISEALAAVIMQTTPPRKWIIVSDGSTDRTDDIVRDYCRRHDFIELLRVDQALGRGVVSKVKALQIAYGRLNDVQYEFIGNVDADVSFNPSYFETQLARFSEDPQLGIAGGVILDRGNGHFRRRFSNRLRSVAHAAQLVRRQCYVEFGGYQALKYGGEDWCAEISARMLGWRVQAFGDLEVFHHRATGSADPLLRHRFREGKMDFSFGSDPAFEVLKCVRRIPEQPMVFGAIARFMGFGWACVRREQRLVPGPVVTFLRSEQRQRLWQLLLRPRAILKRLTASRQSAIGHQ